LSEELFRLLLHVQSPPLSRIVTPFDGVNDIGPGLGASAVVLSVYSFPFEHAKEALGRGIVGAAPHRTQEKTAERG
jgi:hypothetical protein